MTDEDREQDGSIDRRRLMQASGTGLAAALAGCSGGGGDGGDGGSGGGGGGGSGGDGGSGDGGSSEKKEVHILTDYTSKAWQERWEKEIKPGFEEKHSDVKLKIEYTGMQGNAMQRLTTLLQSGNPPNSFQSTPDTTTPMHLQDQTIPTTDVVNFLQDTHGEIFKADSIKWDGEYWYVPHGMYIEQVFNFRRDIYEQLSISEPTNWDEMLNAAETIDNDSDISARGFAIAGVKAGKAGSDFEFLMATADARLLRWKNKDENVAELWFPEEEAIETLSYMEQLAEFSPDPSSISWGEALKYWAGGRAAQQLMLNAWPAGVAAGAGADEIAKGTDIAPIPNKPGVDPADRGFIELDSATLLDAPNKAEAKEFFKYLYRDTENVVKNHAMEPTRFIPIYDGITETEQYKNIDLLSKYDGHLLKLNQKCVDEVLPHMNAEERVRNLQRYYIARFPLLSEMVNQVLIQGRNKKDAYREARDKAEKRLGEANEKLGISG